MLKKEDVKGIIKLKDKEKLTYQDIANKFNASPSTIFYRYKLGKERYPEIFKENSKNILNIPKINLENPENSLKKSDNPIPDIVKRVENPKNWRQKKDNSLEKKDNSLEEEGDTLEERDNTFEKKDNVVEIKHKGNWLFLVVVAVIIGFVIYMVVRELKEGGGGTKVESPEPQSQPPVSTVEPGREWTRE